MADQLDLSLPETAKRPKGSSSLVPALLAIVILLGAVNLVVTLTGGKRSAATPFAQTSDGDAHKDLALRLEKSDLPVAAAQVWQEHLSTAAPDAEETAKIHYRIGKLYQEAGDYEKALTHYYRSENAAALDDLSLEMSRRVGRCLDMLGKFSAMDRDFAERTRIDDSLAAPGDTIVAEIGTEKISAADLDRRIEKLIDAQLARLASMAPPEELSAQKKQMLKALDNPSQRTALLNEIILQEIMYRKARQEKLAEDPDVRQLLRDTEKSILAQRLIGRELSVRIQITPGDVATYYEAHKDEYTEPEKIQISAILVGDEETAGSVRKRLDTQETFRDVAKELSRDSATRKSGGEIKDWLSETELAARLGADPETAEKLFAAEEGSVADGAVKSDRGLWIVKVRSRKPSAQKPLQDVRAEAYRALRRQKEREVTEALAARLKEEFNVVIHHTALSSKTPGDTEPEKDE